MSRRALTGREKSRRLLVYVCFYAAWAFAWPAIQLMSVARRLDDLMQWLADPERSAARAHTKAQLKDIVETLRAERKQRTRKEGD